MFQSIFLALVLAMGTRPGNQPQLCDLTVSKAPTFRKMHLGMDVEEVYKLLPELKDDLRFQMEVRSAKESFLPREVVHSISSDTDLYKNSEVVRGLRGLTISFFDTKVSTLVYDYKRPVWDHVNDFIDRLRSALELPDSNLAEGNVTTKSWNCGEVLIQVSIEGEGGRVRIADQTVWKRMENRRREILKKERDEFRP